MMMNHFISAMGDWMILPESEVSDHYPIEEKSFVEASMYNIFVTKWEKSQIKKKLCIVCEFKKKNI